MEEEATLKSMGQAVVTLLLHLVQARNSEQTYYYVRGLKMKFTNSPPCAYRGSSGQKPHCGLMTLAYQSFIAVLLLIYGSLFLSGVYYCLNVFSCAVARMSKLELEQRTNIKFLVRFEVSTAVTMMIIIFWEMVLIRATRRHLPEDDNHSISS
jgi:hypothetical protein